MSHRPDSLGHVLVVDDEPDFLGLLCLQLRRRGYDVKAAQSGREALERLRHAAESGNRMFDLVLLDLMMPEMDGIQVLEAIRSNSLLAATPVIALTCKSAVEDKVQAFHAGARDYVTKPFHEEELLARMENVLCLDRTVRLLADTNQSLVALQECSRALGGTLELSELLEVILKELSRVVKYDSASIMFLSRDQLEVVAREGFPPEMEYLSPEILAARPHVQSVLEEGRPRIIPDTAADSGWIPTSGTESIRCWMGVPLISKGRVIGLLNLDKQIARYFSQHHEGIALAFAAQAAVAIENALAYSDLHATHTRLDALVASSPDAVIAIDAEDLVVEFNARAEELTGYSAEEILDKTVARFHMDIEAAREIHRVVCEKGGVSEWSVTLQHKNGDEVPCKLFARLLKDKDGAQIGQVGYLKDLRDVRLLEGRLRALIRANKAIGSARSLDDVLRRIVNSALIAFPKAQRGSIHLYDEKADFLNMEIRVPESSSNSLSEARFRPGEGIAGWVFKHNRPLVIPDVSAEPRYVRLKPPGAPTHQSMICAPLRSNGSPVGVLVLSNMDSTNAFSDADLGLFCTFADQSALAIDTARRFTKIQQETDDRHLLQTISTRISAQTDVDQVLQAVAEGASKLLGSEMGAVAHLVDPDSGAISRSLATPEWMKTLVTPPREEDGLTVQVMSALKPMVVSDTENTELAVNPLVVDVGIRSFVGFPLVVRGNSTGAIFLNSKRPEVFGEREVGLVSLLVAQAAVTIETAALIEKDRMMLRRLRMLSAASVEMMDNLSSLRLPERIKLILRNLAVILEAEAASFFRVERPGFLTKRGCYGHVEEDYNIGREFAIKSEPGGGLTGHIAFEAKPFRAHGDDLRNHWAVAGRDVTHVRSGECHSLLALPLLRSQRGEVELVGLLEVENRLGPDGQPDSEIWFTPEDQYLMNVFAQSVLVSLENADLFERTSDQLEKRVHALKTLHDAGTAITGAGSLPDVLRLIVREARELTAIEGEKAQLGYIALLHDRKLELVEADPPELVSELRGRIGTIDLDGTGPIGVVGRVVASGKGELVREPERDPDYIKLRDGIRCLLAMPMSFGQETIGAVVLQHTHPMAFDSGDERDLGLLAAQATIAINNVRRYEELMRVKGLIGSRTALAWMGMVTNHLRHKIQNNIVTCQAKLEQLRRSLPRRDLSPRVEDILEVLDSKLMLILGAPVAPLPLEKAGSVALNHAIAGRLEVLDSTERYRSVECCFETTLPDTATVRAGREWLQKALDVLGDNSVEAMIGCSIQRLSVEITDAGQWAEIRVTDTGRGVSESVQRDLFERPIAKKKVETGLGMGLLMVRLIVETYGGDIRLESPGPGDTTFLIRLPLEQ